MRDHGIRLTRQRELIFDIIHSSQRHLNAEQIYASAKKRDPKINRVTVYRTLKLLKQEALVDELDLMHFSGEHHYYETRLKREHAHLICLRCGQVQEYFGEAIRRMRNQIENEFGFRIWAARTEVGGVCADCQRMGRPSKAASKLVKAAPHLPDGSSLAKSLRERGIRMTRQRELLFDIIHNAREHLNAEQLLERAKERDEKINPVTVYRTLKLLKQEGLIDELDLMHYEGDQHYYETRLKREHAHLVCLRTGKVQEYFGQPLQQLREEIETEFGFRVRVTRAEFGGLCADAQRLEWSEDSVPEPDAPGAVANGV